VASHFGTAIGQMVQPPRPEVPELPVSLGPRPPLLAGREALLADLDARLTSNEGTEPRIVALYGLGGTGKTSVAVEYAHRHLAEVGLAWQLPAEDPALLLAEFARLAAQLGAREVVDARDPVASVHGVLAAFPNEWLLVFDNDPGQQEVQRFLPPAGNGRVLITSQSAAWPRDWAVEVRVLDTPVAAGFLVKRTGDPDERAAEDLAAGLGGLPLALEQAAAYMTAIGGTPAGYLALFRQRRAELLARGEPTGYSKTVASTWALAFDRLRQTESGAAAVGLLRLLAFCAPEAVPLRLLLQPRPGLAGRLGDEVVPALAPLLEDPLAASDAIGALRRYSLVTPAADGSVSLHRLVQAVTADQMPAELARKWQQATAALIEDTIPSDTGHPETWPVCAALLPHAQAALADDSKGMARIAHYLGSIGNYAAAHDFHQRVLKARERVLGPEHPDTLTARHQLARWTGQAGDPAAARDLFAGLLPVRERVLGPEHPDTLAARHQLARWTGHAGDPAAAREQLAGLLPVRERVLGPEHPDTLTARHQLARWTGQAGDPAAARDLFAGLLPVRERILGPEHPDTLTARYLLARWTGEAGDPTAAQDLSAGLLPVRERVLGPEHPHTLVTRHQLARWTGEAGDPAAARDLFAGLLPVQERVLGPEHPDTLPTQYELAHWTGEAGDPAAAREQLAGLLPVFERVLGPEHPDTLTARHQLATWTGEAGDPAAAREQLAGLLPVFERVLGPEHPHTLVTRANLTRWTGRADGGPSTA
jgi:Tetratricopeptide repeat